MCFGTNMEDKGIFGPLLVYLKKKCSTKNLDPDPQITMKPLKQKMHSRGARESLYIPPNMQFVDAGYLTVWENSNKCKTVWL